MSKADDQAIRTQEEVARIMTARGYPMGKSAVYETEQRALRKLRWVLVQIARDLGYGREGGAK